MATNGDDKQVTQNSSEFFESIGSRVEGLAPGTDNGDGDASAELRSVEEIESLCMNCEENVSQTTQSVLLATPVTVALAASH